MNQLLGILPKKINIPADAMEGPPESNDPRYSTSLYVDERFNFPERILSQDDLTFIRDAICDGDEGVMAAINSGLPMQSYVLDSLLSIRVKHRFSKVRLILEPIIAFTVTVSHFYNGRRIFREATTKRAQMFTSSDIQRLDSGLRRLYRATGTLDNPYDLLEAVEELDVTQGVYQSHLQSIYRLLTKINFDISMTQQLDFTGLSVFNYIFDAPKFTTQEAIAMYTSNLADITRRAQRPLSALTVSKRSKDVHDVLNDIMFSLALGNMIIRHEDALKALKKSLLMKLNNLCAKLYMTYTQVPSTKEIFLEIAKESFALVSSESEDPPEFGRVIASMLRFVRAVITADVYANPDYVTQQVFAVNSRIYDLEGAAVGHGTDLDVEMDPTSPYTASYYITNPYTDKNIFKCPKDLTSYMGRSMIKKKLTQDLVTECTDNSLTYETFELDMLGDLILEGAAKHLKITLEQLSHYLETVNSPADVIDEETADVDLFADVEIRAPPRNRGPDRTPRFTNIKGAKPYQASRPTRTVPLESHV